MDSSASTNGIKQTQFECILLYEATPCERLIFQFVKMDKMEIKKEIQLRPQTTFKPGKLIRTKCEFPVTRPMPMPKPKKKPVIPECLERKWEFNDIIITYLLNEGGAEVLELVNLYQHSAHAPFREMFPKKSFNSMLRKLPGLTYLHDEKTWEVTDRDALIYHFSEHHATLVDMFGENFLNPYFDEDEYFD